MIIEDFTRPDEERRDLDELLAELCEYVIGGQRFHPEFYGMVAAGVLDPSNRFIIGINFEAPDGRRVHAERAAIERYKKTFGDIPENSMILTTLSPCNRPMDERYGESCTDLLESEGLNHVYCGYRDPSQDSDLSAETTNLKIKTLCKAFADTFLKKDLTELKIDNVNGLGSVPWNQDVDYKGLRVQMKPSMFLQLALPLNRTDDDEKRIDYLAKHKDDEGFGAPFLQVDMDRDFPRITGHDGRHRMEAILNTEGDHPVEVHIFPLYLRNRDMTPERINKLNDIVVSQRGKYVVGPIFTQKLDEISRRDFMKAGALGAATAVSGGIGLNRIKHQLDRPTAPISNSIEKLALHAARDAGIKGQELAAFLAQMKHESQNFTKMKEVGTKNSIKYDPRVNPAKAKRLGNTQLGDGERYKGRGLIQLTGRENYRRAGRALGLPLEERPELAENPQIAADIAVWYWKTRVRPHVTDWTNTAQVTKPINAGLHGLDRREKNFQKYMMARLDEVIIVPTLSKSKREHTDVLPNTGKPIPKGSEADFLGKHVGDINDTAQVWQYNTGPAMNFVVFNPETRRSQLAVSGTRFRDNPDSFIVGGVFAGPKNTVRASTLYYWLIKNLGLTFISDKKQSEGGQRVWQELQRRYGKNLNIHAFDTAIDEPINTDTKDDSDTHVSQETLPRATPDQRHTAKNVRMVASLK